MKNKKGIILGGVAVVALILIAAIIFPKAHSEKEQAKLYLDPLITEANLLSSSIEDVTSKKNNDISVELGVVQDQLASFVTVALETKNITKSEIEGFSDFDLVLGHCQSRIRVMVEAVEKGESLVPDEISFLNTLEHSVSVLGASLKKDNGTLNVTTAKQYSDVITVFTEAIHETGK